MFEGSEKKIELIFSKDSPSLLEKPAGFWKQIVKSAKAQIISHEKGAELHAYLLSESSLLIWQNRLVLITCGKTVLSKAFIKLIKAFPKNSIELYFFQRKNEFFPYDQTSSFYSDLKKIERPLPGKAYRFGSLHNHHFFLFYNEIKYKVTSPDQTLEILFYDSKTIKDTSKKTILTLKNRLKNIFKGFKIQDHFFKPSGYSLNAIKDHFYYTIHITPEESFFYISFETNFNSLQSSEIIKKILPVFQPIHFDLILFQSQHYPSFKLDLKKFFPQSSFYKKLNNSYHVYYKTFYSTQKSTQKPVLVVPNYQKKPKTKNTK